MQTIRGFRTFPVRACAVVCAAVLVASCIENQNAPPLAGPSGFGQSLTLTASPDILPRDGASQSVVIINYHDTSTDAPLAGRTLHLSTTAGSLSAGQVVTDAGGNASVVFVAPGLGSGDSEARVSATPIGTNASNARANSVVIGLFGPAPPVAEFTVTPDTVSAGSQVVLDASPSTFGTGVPAKDYRWQFGDGTPDVVGVAVTTHTFVAAGAYPVILTVTDQLDRTSSKVVVVTVN